MLEISINTDSLDRLIARLHEAPALVAQQIHAGLVDATGTVYAEVAQRTPVRTGNLRDSLSARVVGSGASARGLVAFGAEYARPVEEGRPPQVIRPRHKKALRFTVGGRVVFATSVNHPGFAGRHMMARGLQAAKPRVRRIFSARLGVVTRKLAGH